MGHQVRPRFDRTKEFQVRRRIKIHGREFEPGEPFATHLCTDRLLRQLYERGDLSYMTNPVPVSTAPVSTLDQELQAPAKEEVPVVETKKSGPRERVPLIKRRRSNPNRLSV